MDQQEMAFLAWMDQVDAHLLTQVEMDSSRLPDQTFWDWFEEGMTPREASLRTIENALSG